MGTEDGKHVFIANQQPTSLLEPAAQNIGNMTNENLIFSKRSFVVRKGCVYAVKAIVVMTPIQIYTNSTAEV